MDSQVLLGAESAPFGKLQTCHGSGSRESRYECQLSGRIERGEKWPSLEIIQRLAGTLSVSPSAFLEFEAEETDSNILLTKLHHVLSNRNTTNSSRHFDFSGLSSNSDSR